LTSILTFIVSSSASCPSVEKGRGEEEGLTLNELLRRGQLQWHGVKLNQPDWGIIPHPGCTVRSIKGRFLIHMIFNPYWEALEFEVPPAGRVRHPPASLIDTSLNSPDDICEGARAPLYPV